MSNPFPNQIPFIEQFGTRRGRWLANRLRLSGSGSEKLANNVSAFFRNLSAAIVVEKKNEMKANKTANNYSVACRLIYDDIISSELYNKMWGWVIYDLNKAAKWLKMVG
jgi:hypothetical protein